jgi:DNA polymerase III epsilon subunit-like protein
MYLIFDIETTGLPITKHFNVFYTYTDNSKYDSSRIVQIAWKIIGKCPKYKDITFKNYIIKRDDFNIRNKEFHGISNEISDKDGIPFKEVIKIFMNDLLNCETIVAHNIIFDYNVLLNHLYRYKLFDEIETLKTKKQYCTMLNSINILKIPLRNNSKQFKSTSLKEVYFHYFKKDIENAHNAYYDVEACSQCLLMLLQEKN